ncbi:MAG TPA: hypothetical protein VLA34_12500 [Candidatus Krumholzibacterium sp.]|nr:hypothetical protein [Candidatus Krumholzibacterium sp.]
MDGMCDVGDRRKGDKAKHDNAKDTNGDDEPGAKGTGVDPEDGSGRRT